MNNFEEDFVEVTYKLIDLVSGEEVFTDDLGEIREVVASWFDGPNDYDQKDVETVLQVLSKGALPDHRLEDALDLQIKELHLT